jgi:hypothetical protein
VSTNTEQQTQVNTESTDVGTSLTADPEDTEVALIVELVQLALVDGTDTELTLDGRDQGRTLEKSTSEGLQGAAELSLATGDLVVQTDHAHVLLTGTLLGLDETGGTVNADNQAASDLGVESTTVTGLLGSIKREYVRINWPSRIWRGAMGSEEGFYLRMRFIHATTSWEEGLEGLSRLITPELT